MATLQMVLVPSPSVQSQGVSSSVLSGITYGTAMVCCSIAPFPYQEELLILNTMLAFCFQLHYVGAPFSQPIAPVTYMWRPHEKSKEDGNNNCHDVIECNEPCRIGFRSCFRQLWIWIHASAFSKGYDAIKCACQKLVNDISLDLIIMYLIIVHFNEAHECEQAISFGLRKILSINITGCYYLRC